MILMSREARKPGFVTCEQQRRRPACASAKSDQHLCYSLYENYSHPCADQERRGSGVPDPLEKKNKNVEAKI